MLCGLMLLVLSGIAWLWICCSVFLDVAMNSGGFGGWCGFPGVWILTSGLGLLVGLISCGLAQYSWLAWNVCWCW